MAKIILELCFLLMLFQAGMAEYKRVCYYANWSQYRTGIGAFLPSDIDPDLCTHIIYAFGKLVGNTVMSTEYNDNDLYKGVNKLKERNPSLKTLLALGGWNAGSIVYSQMVSTFESRSQFINSAIQYMRNIEFDGLDIDWEYPANRGGAPSDKINFGLLVKELRAAFNLEAEQSGKDRLLLTAAVSAGKGTIDSAYDVPSMAESMDFINLMTYDLHGSWESLTGHNSPLFARSNEQWYQRYLNIEYVANYWHSLGVPKYKLIIGMATYGRSFTLSSSQTGIGAQASGPGISGTVTREAGILSYYEICARQNSGNGRTVYDSEQMVPYYTDGSLWVGFDDETSLSYKVEWLVSQGFGGAMVWELSLDDFNNLCSKGRFPLLSKIKDLLLIADNGGTLTTPGMFTGLSSASKPPSTTSDWSAHDENVNANDFCSGKDIGFYPYTSHCNTYFWCYSGGAALKICPSGLLWNINQDACDWPSNVNCIEVDSKTESTHRSSSSSTPATTATSIESTPNISTKKLNSITTSTQTTLPASTDVLLPDFCGSRPDGNFAHPSDCSKYITCYRNQVYIRSCPPSLLWNAISGICDWTKNVNCSI